MKKFVHLWVCLTLLGCNFNEIEVDNLTVQNYQGLVSLPIGEVTYSFTDLLEQVSDPSEFELGDDSIFVLVYNDTVSFSNTEEILAFGDIGNSASVNLPSTSASSQAVTVSFEQSFQFDYNPSQNEGVDSIVYNTGEIFLQLVSSVGGDVNYTFTIENTTNNNTGNRVSLNGVVPANSTAEQIQSLVNHSTFLTRIDSSNTFNVNFSGTINLPAGQGITSANTLSFTLTYRDQTFESVFGFFGQDEIQIGNQLLDVSFFEELGAGIVFEDPQVNFTFTNSYGVPIGLRFGSIFSAPEGFDTTFLSGSVTESAQIIDYPDETQVGESVRDTTISINATNSNFRDLLANSPSQLGFDIQAITNPNSTTERNFVTNSSALDAEYEIRLPLSVQLNDLTRSVNLDYGEIDVSNADSVVLRFVTENELPMSGELTLFILDEDSTVLYEVPDNPFLAAPRVNADGVVIEGEVEFSNVILSPEGVEAFGNGRQLTMQITLNTSDRVNSREIFVDLLTQYSLEIKVSIIAQLDIEL